MRITVIALSDRPGEGRPSVEFRADCGSATARWAGDQEASPGEHSIEFTVEPDDVVWGEDLRPATEAGDQIRAEGGRIVLRGRLSVGEGHFCDVNLGGTCVDLGPQKTIPATASNSWVELVLAQSDLTLYPFTL